MNNNYIKVNLPESQDAFIQGSGEGVFCIVSDEAKAAYDADEEGTTYDGILDNDSIYWPGLTHGARIPFEMRGDRRPVVPYEWLLKWRLNLSLTAETKYFQRYQTLTDLEKIA